MSMEALQVQVSNSGEEKTLNPEESHEDFQDDHPEDQQGRSVKRRIRVGKKYHHIKNTIRKQLISRVESKGEKIIDVAKELGMKYSTAKSILKVYRSEGRTNKIPKSQRYLSLRVPDPEDFPPAEKIPVNRRKKTEKAEKNEQPQPPTLEENLPGYEGPATRQRTGKKDNKKSKAVEKSAPAECKREVDAEDAKEPKLRKKLAQEIVPKIEAATANLKEETSPFDDTCRAKKEDEFEEYSKVREQAEDQRKTLSNESSNEGIEISRHGLHARLPHPMIPEMMPTMMMPVPPTNSYLNPFGMDLAQIRLQNMAMYLQTLRLQSLLLKSGSHSHTKQF